MRTLNVKLPASALTDPGISAWLVKNTTIIEGSINLKFGEKKKALLDDAGVAKAVSLGAVFSGDVCFAVQVNTPILSVDVPNAYDSPIRDWVTTDEAGEEVRTRKTVEELMVCIRGTEGKSLILCAEKSNNGNGTGLQQAELERFMGYFTDFYVFTLAQLSQWKTNNIVEET